MSFRAQYAYPPAPAGFRDEDFIFTFDGLNTPALAQGIAALDSIQNIVLKLDRDAPFVWRGTKIFSNAVVLGARFRSPDGEAMADDYAPLMLSQFPSGFGIVGTFPVAGEPEVRCPVGGVILLDLANLSLGGVVGPRTFVQLYGVKRWKVEAKQ